MFAKLLQPSPVPDSVEGRPEQPRLRIESKSGKSVPGDQASVWLREGAASRFVEERRAGADAVRVVESVDVAPAIVAGGGRVVRMNREELPEASRN